MEKYKGRNYQGGGDFLVDILPTAKEARLQGNIVLTTPSKNN